MIHAKTYEAHGTRVRLHLLEGDSATEIYATLIPLSRRSASEQASGLFRAARDIIEEHRLKILSERILAVPDAWSVVGAERASTYGDLCPEGAPTCLQVPHGRTTPVAGMQIHGVRTGNVFCVQDPEAGAHVRVLRGAHRSWVSVSGLTAPDAGAAGDQARAMFDRLAAIMEEAGGDMRSVARTWLWLGDILSWYDALNCSRSASFREHGLIDDEKRQVWLPASTGIGIEPAGNGICALDAIAVLGDESSVQLHQAGGDQHSAYEYGSAFSRASTAIMPAGRTHFISGTAAIDASGRTEHEGRIESQIADTLAHIRSLVKDIGADEKNAVACLVYSKNEAVEKAFLEQWGDLEWPYIEVIADVCRPELLFEVELTLGE